MTKRAEILSELQEITAVADRFSPDMPYAVPLDYFALLSENVLRRVQANEAISATEELEILSPLLSKIDRKTPFQQPEGYFEQLQVNQVAEIDGGKKKSAEIIKVLFTRTMARYSIAAAVASLIVLGTWRLLNAPATEGDKLTSVDIWEKVREISDSEMKAYLEGSTTNVVYQN
ncbi:MAG: hypothetical protein H7Y03_10515, partial [Chitinophagaceae bacterium]|nr:hypothetical protein [Chitinophagaceae bacterium]